MSRLAALLSLFVVIGDVAAAVLLPWKNSDGSKHDFPDKTTFIVCMTVSLVTKSIIGGVSLTIKLLSSSAADSPVSTALLVVNMALLLLQVVTVICMWMHFRSNVADQHVAPAQCNPTQPKDCSNKVVPYSTLQ